MAIGANPMSKRQRQFAEEMDIKVSVSFQWLYLLTTVCSLLLLLLLMLMLVQIYRLGAPVGTEIDDAYPPFRCIRPRPPLLSCP